MATQKQKITYLEMMLRQKRIAESRNKMRVARIIEDEIEAKRKKWRLPYPQIESLSVGEPIQSYENECVLHLPGRSRPTLSQYDNRRSGTIIDRYYFGIYPRDS